MVETANNYSLLNDENLNRLRKKQKDMLMTKRLFDNRLDDTDQLSVSSHGSHGFEFNESRAPVKEPEIVVSKKEGDEHGGEASRPENSSFNQFKSVINSQKQLKQYIENLEIKLNNLKNEISVTNGNENNNGPTEQRERTLSSESCDSLKELSTHTENQQPKRGDVYGDYLLQRRFVLKQDSTRVDEDDQCEKAFLAEVQSNSQSGITTATVSRDTEADSDLLKKSLHKGNLTDFYFSKLKNGSTSSSASASSSSCKFSPIISNNNNTGDVPGQTELTPRTYKNLINPIPIKVNTNTSLSGSSSFDSSSTLGKSTHSTVNNKDLNSSNSKIWNRVSALSNVLNEPTAEPNTNNKKWSHILGEPDNLKTTISVGQIKPK